MASPLIVGIDIGGTKCAVSLREEGQAIREIHRFSTQGPEATLSEIERVIAAATASTNRAFVIGISAGTLGAAEGLICDAPNLPGWDRVPVVKRFADRFGVPAYLLNDAKACALAEWLYGAGQGARHMAFLTLGTGLGAGLILDGKLYLGAGNAGEIGHVRLAPDGPLGYGKFGSAEGFASGGGIGRTAQSALQSRGLAAGFGGIPRDQVTARDVIVAATNHDPLAREILAQAGRKLGEALALLIDLLNLDCIVLGSIYVRAQPFLEPAMREVLVAEALPASLAGCRIVPAALGEAVGNYGAIAAADYHLR